MDDPLTTALGVTGIGMLVLFLALAILYALMYALTELTKDRPEEGADEHGNGGADKQRVMRRRAALIAVAIARAEHDLNTAGFQEGQETTVRERVSPWRAHHHQRQLTHAPRPRRAR